VTFTQYNWLATRVISVVLSSILTFYLTQKALNKIIMLFTVAVAFTKLSLCECFFFFVCLSINLFAISLLCLFFFPSLLDTVRNSTEYPRLRANYTLERAGMYWWTCMEYKSQIVSNKNMKKFYLSSKFRRRPFLLELYSISYPLSIPLS